MKPLTIGDLRDTISKWTDINRLREDAVMVLYDDELGEYHAVLQAKIVGGCVLISGYDDDGNEGSRVEIEEAVNAK